MDVEPCMRRGHHDPRNNPLEIKYKEICILLLTVSSFLKCDATEYQIPRGYDWMTRGGQLFIKAGRPPRYLAVPRDESLEEHSWLVHDKPKPEEVDIVPLSRDIKRLIVNEMNTKRAKILLGAYFDPERARDFGVVPPLAELSTVEYNEDIALAAERYIQHDIFEHYDPKSFYPFAPLSDNLDVRVESIERDGSEMHKTPYQIANDHMDLKSLVLFSFKRWFNDEIIYYKHYEPFRFSLLKSEVEEFFRTPMRNNGTLTHKNRNRQTSYMIFGHFTAMIAKKINSVGCAVIRRRRFDKEEKYPHLIVYRYFFACYFGGGKYTDGGAIIEMDENFLQQHGLSKSHFQHS